MLTNFYTDLEKAKIAEAIALEQLQAYYDYWTLEDVSNVKECRYLGDIKATERVINCVGEKFQEKHFKKVLFKIYTNISENS